MHFNEIPELTRKEQKINMKSNIYREWIKNMGADKYHCYENYSWKSICGKRKGFFHINHGESDHYVKICKKCLKIIQDKGKTK